MFPRHWSFPSVIRTYGLCLPAFSRTVSLRIFAYLSSTKVEFILHNGLDTAKLTLTCDFCHHFYQGLSKNWVCFHLLSSGVTKQTQKWDFCCKDLSPRTVSSAKLRTISRIVRHAQWNQSLVLLVLTAQTETQGHKGRAQSNLPITKSLPSTRPAEMSSWETPSAVSARTKKMCSISGPCMSLLSERVLALPGFSCWIYRTKKAGGSLPPAQRLFLRLRLF